MEIVSDITDERDFAFDAAVVQEAEGVWIMDGDLHLDEVERLLDRTLPRKDVETLAGLLVVAGYRVRAADLHARSQNAGL